MIFHLAIYTFFKFTASLISLKKGSSQIYPITQTLQRVIFFQIVMDLYDVDDDDELLLWYS